uniref:Uncharacterized protein n=1 Tax=Anguilla anguilla TaxID=7936 RepID=A0A0E9VGC4_ANGAN
MFRGVIFYFKLAMLLACFQILITNELFQF